MNDILEQIDILTQLNLLGWTQNIAPIFNKQHIESSENVTITNAGGVALKKPMDVTVHIHKSGEKEAVHEDTEIRVTCGEEHDVLWVFGMTIQAVYQSLASQPILTNESKQTLKELQEYF